MTRDEMEVEVGKLLALRRKAARLGTDLSPDKLMLLKRLLTRLGWTREVRGMSRAKPQNLSRRPARLLKYASATVARIRDVPNHTMRHSRLAIVLREIRHTLGKSDPRLKALTDKALGGVISDPVFIGIRDRLLQSKDKRAQELARQYNWHRVTAGLERDQHLRDYVYAATKGGKHEGTGQELRRFYNAVVMGVPGTVKGEVGISPQAMSDAHRLRFYNHMAAHLKQKTGRSHSFEEIQRSLRRIGETEHNEEQIKLAPRIARRSDKTGRGIRDTEKIRVPDYKTSAWTGADDAVRARPNAHIQPGQFRRSSLVRKYGNWFRKSPQQTPPPIPQREAIDAGIEHAALHRALEHASAMPHREEGESFPDYEHRRLQFVADLHAAIREYAQERPNDLLTQHYQNHAAQVENKARGNVRRNQPVDEMLAPGFLPFVRMFKQHGLPLPRTLKSNQPSQPQAEHGVDLNQSQYHDLLAPIPYAETERSLDKSLPIPVQGQQSIGQNTGEFRLPSGFVELPQQPSRPKPSSNRKEIYQTIANWHDNQFAGGLTPSTRKDASALNKHLVETHGISPQEAARHISNFNRQKRKATANNPPTDIRRPYSRGVHRYAKADKNRAVAHPSIAGFPIEHALRSLANDPNNTDDVRNIAKTVLTGDGKPEGAPEGLWALHDALQEHPNRDGTTGHPLAKAYNWLSAADKLILDGHTRKALEEEAAHRRALATEPTHVPDSPGEHQWQYTPESVAQNAAWGTHGNNPDVMPNRSAARIALANRIKDRVKKLSPHASDEHIVESIRRHGFRAGRVWNMEHGVGEEANASRALIPQHELTGTNPNAIGERATRYRAKPDSVSGLPRRVIRYAKVPQSESGTLNDEQLAIARGAHENNDLTAWGVLGDHLAENGFPNAGAVLSRVSEGSPGSQYIAGGTLIRPKPAGHFRFLVLRDGSDLIHRLELSTHHNQASHVFTYRMRPHQMARTAKPSRYAFDKRNDFIQALRRARSSQMKQLAKAAQVIAARSGFAHTTTHASLHDTPHGSVPGLSAAIYGAGRPEAVHAAASWFALQNEQPGVGVFHLRAQGPDKLYRVREAGSALDLRARLDRYGIGQRVMIPHERGYDVVIADPGGRLNANVRKYASDNSVELQESRGYFRTIGSPDKSQAREQFRGEIVKSEKKARKSNAVSDIPKIYGVWNDEIGEDRYSKPINDSHKIYERMVREKLSRLSTGDKWPFEPVSVKRSIGSFNLEDGHHRIEAARRLGMSIIPATLIDVKSFGSEKPVNTFIEIGRDGKHRVVVPNNTSLPPIEVTVPKKSRRAK